MNKKGVKKKKSKPKKSRFYQQTGNFDDMLNLNIQRNFFYLKFHFKRRDEKQDNIFDLEARDN